MDLYLAWQVWELNGLELGITPGPCMQLGVAS